MFFSYQCRLAGGPYGGRAKHVGFVEDKHINILEIEAGNMGIVRAQ